MTDAAELEVSAVDASSLQVVPAPAEEGARCQTCSYWELLDGSRRSDGARFDEAAKLRRLTAGIRLGGSYASVAFHGSGDDRAAVGYVQFGPISAYPRAQAIRDRYPGLPDSPPPWVVTCLQVVAGPEREVVAVRLLAALCADLDRRGVLAVEAYPERRAEPWLASPGPADVYEAAGFSSVAGDDRYPVYRIELAGEADATAWPADLLRAPADDDAWPLPLPKTPDADAWPIPSRPKIRNPFGED